MIGENGARSGYSWSSSSVNSYYVATLSVPPWNSATWERVREFLRFFVNFRENATFFSRIFRKKIYISLEICKDVTFNSKKTKIYLEFRTRNPVTIKMEFYFYKYNILLYIYTYFYKYNIIWILLQTVMRTSYSQMYEIKVLEPVRFKLTY